MSVSAAISAEPVPVKRRQILLGARQVFAEMGFERASVDLIASRAGVSKATVYNHFEDKKALFVACATQEADEMREGLRACLGEPAGDVEHVLQVIGEKVMTLSLSPAIVALYRHVSPEAARFPDIGQMIFDRGPRVLHDAIGSYLERWDRSGALRIDDARAAAVQFLALCQGELVLRSRLGILTYPVDEQVRETVSRAVRTFVRAFRP
ncbi:MAG TPA: TetR/AcrR family transcriptional regulator [Anaeromyxobacter sp.]|nr:TetR/AcrR family transcriptional regulator [Anaeromyxobacter sp.]